ncbi:MAG: hypothetical protein A2039_00195 [Candidatus Melainabacteria bacterium GWA2_34_9]|nr:MAG: hypothetical protein A2039_00195 [Candidatus Melainabacteria bacterium GWA2_34_9]
MDKELIYKKIDDLIEMRKILWTVLVVLTGGIFGLIINIISPFKFNIELVVKSIIISLGFFLDYVLILIIKDNNEEINNFFIKLAKGE